ncbi:hypothetical protein [Paenibacillus sp. PL91]|uniref:hypothetical protein n=1 Tax=Paenibacillus sp. PL91 TaxID=2729538 RepID=UPI00145DCDE4|nr:hypothetical protein [Paenibacillus sp. PL91]MBC9205088.1 hypothetical protein [Paenibacillus sp. PL91]
MPFPNSESLQKAIQEYFKKPRVDHTSEEALIQILEERKNKHSIYYAILALRDVGTQKSISALKSLYDYPMQDIKDCSLLTISHIAGVSETDYYISIYNQKGTKKGYAIWAISDSGDERAFELVTSYLEKEYKKILAGKCNNDIFIMGLQYLLRFISYNTKAEVLIQKYLSAAEFIPNEYKYSFNKITVLYATKHHLK